MLPSVTLNASLLGFYIGVSGINNRSNDFFFKTLFDADIRDL